MEPMRILALCDAPNKTTGFGRVANNLARRWVAAGAKVDVWGIGYHGERHDFPGHIYPAAGDSGGVYLPWNSHQRLSVFLRELIHGGYTHCWIMQDTFQLCGANFPEELSTHCRARGIRTLFYFPVDAPVDPSWVKLVDAVDVAVAYTEYGRQEIGRYTDREIRVLPHGIDPVFFQPCPANLAERPLKLSFGSGELEVGPGEILLLNVGAHQRRKDPVRSLMILRQLLRMGVKAQLLFHFDGQPESRDGVDLAAAARQLGLPKGSWTWVGKLAGRTRLSDDELVLLYQCADLVLTTTLGEGWGLTVTEALATGATVAAPVHTSLAEIRQRLPDKRQWIELPLAKDPVCLPMDNSRLRYPVDVVGAAREIRASYRRRPRQGDLDLAGELDWDTIAADWLKLFRAEALENGTHPGAAATSNPTEQPQAPEPAAAHS